MVEQRQGSLYIRIWGVRVVVYGLFGYTGVMYNKSSSANGKDPNPVTADDWTGVGLGI
jgi:hypothetical protein